MDILLNIDYISVSMVTSEKACLIMFFNSLLSLGWEWWTLLIMNPHRNKLHTISSTSNRSLGIIIEIINDEFWIQNSLLMSSGFSHCSGWLQLLELFLNRLIKRSTYLLIDLFETKSLYKSALSGHNAFRLCRYHKTCSFFNGERHLEKYIVTFFMSWTYRVFHK